MSDKNYPDTIEIRPLAGPPRARIRVPGSKSITNRALILSALSDHGCTLTAALRSEDTEVMIAALRGLGFEVEADWDRATIQVSRRPGDAIIPARNAELFVANSGTSMRFLTALACLGDGRYRLDGVARMRERPIEDLLAALRGLGVRVRGESGNGCPPVVVDAAGIDGGTVEIRGDVSSQFLSGLLMAGAKARSPLTIRVVGKLVSLPYVTMTLAMMRQFGIQVEQKRIEGGLCDPAAENVYYMDAPQSFGRETYAIEPDASAASYFFGAAAITGGTIAVPSLNARSLQGDVEFVNLLARMGCQVSHDGDKLSVTGGPLHGIDVDMNAISDTVMTLAAVALFAEGPTTIRNVAHIRHKETDRLAALTIELRKLGAGVEERSDGLTITPRPLHGAAIDTYNDHRMAMSLALVGLKVPGVVIRNPSCVAKTYPDFFDDLERLR